ncbi:MAG TPA: IS21 family transposase [Acidobacteriaceae bacterium]|nr:IS21 family transposase [Acidobacteriaceae bacterium]
MPGKRVSMRKTREVLRLHFDLHLGQRQIARSANISQSTVHDYLERFTAAGLSWPLPAEMVEAQLEAALFPAALGKGREQDSDRPLPDFARIHEEMQRHKHTTRQLLWEEYRAAHPEGYGYSQFCQLYRRWKQERDLVLRQEHRPGERLFVDWAGATISLYDPQTGEVRQASVFVAVLGASNYTYAEASEDQQLASWIGAHVRTFEFLGGCPQLVVPDNAKTGVLKPCRYEPDLNPTYQEMALHYGVGVLPTRPRKPRDKAKVEVGVQIAERWIIAALRHRQFFSLAELNQAIRELVEKLNQRPFKKREGSRQSLFLEVDQPVLRPLPAERFDLSVWSQATVNIDYHIQFEGSFYSVPYQLARQTVEVRATPTTIEIFHRGQRVASHVRVRKPYTAVTNPEHRPASHRAHLDWPPSRMIAWARTVGPRTAEVVEKILEAFPHPEMGYRSCLGIVRLGQRYPSTRMEAAAERALATGAVSYKSLDSILRHRLDQHPLDPPAARPLAGHDNIRGAAYFE